MLTSSEPSVDISGRRSHKRREHPRAAVDWPATVITYNATYQGKTINASRGGVLIHLTHQLDPGENVRIAIEIPECQEAIIAKAAIVRVFPLKRGVEQPFSHGIALQFTEITEDNLKFFSGNLAAEWNEDFIELDRYPQAALPRQVKPRLSGHKHKHYALWIFAFILLIPILYLLFISFAEKADNRQTAAQLNKRLQTLEQQINSYKSTDDALVYLKEELTNLQIELSALKENLPATETLESMNLELRNQSHLVQQIFDELESYQKPSLADSNDGQQKQIEKYYVVEKGDNLYRISSKTGITIRELRILNSLDADDPISPGQKLMIK